MPYFLDKIERALVEADVFAAIGTSGRVYPAAGFVRLAASCGARTIEFNLEPSEVGADFETHRIDPASVEVPKWVDSVLSPVASA